MINLYPPNKSTVSVIHLGVIIVCIFRNEWLLVLFNNHSVSPPNLRQHSNTDTLRTPYSLSNRNIRMCHYDNDSSKNLRHPLLHGLYLSSAVRTIFEKVWNCFVIIAFAIFISFFIYFRPLAHIIRYFFINFINFINITILTFYSS